MSSPKPPLHDRRRAERLACQVPIRLRSDSCTIVAQAENLSRVGALLRVPLCEIGLPDDAPLQDIGTALRALLGDRTTGEFRYDELGSLISRTMHVVRISRRDRSEPWVEVGFALRRALTDEETGYLRLDLPRVRRDMPAASAPSADDAAPLEIVVCAAAGEVVRAFTATVSHVAAERMRGCTTDLRLLAPEPDRPNLLPVLAAFSGDFTCTPTVALRRAPHTLWMGPCELQGVELDPLRAALTVEFAFAQALAPHDLARLSP